jgi:type III restriction enzyme
MSEAFFDRPILNSPYDYPSQHWELDADWRATITVAGQRQLG